MSAKNLLLALLLAISVEKSVQLPANVLAFARGMSCPNAIANAKANGKLSAAQMNTIVMPMLKKIALGTSVAFGNLTSVSVPDSCADAGKLTLARQQLDTGISSAKTSLESFICYIAEVDTRIRNNNLVVDGAGKGQALPSWIDDNFNENNCTVLINLFGHMMEQGILNPPIADLLKSVKTAFKTDAVCFRDMLEDFAAALGKTEMGNMNSAQIRDLLSKMGRKFWSMTSGVNGLDARARGTIDKCKKNV